MNKTLVSLIVIILVALGAYFLLHSTSKITTINKETPDEIVKTDLIIDKSLVEEKTYTAPDKYSVFKVTYPQFKNVSADFNQKIESQVNAGIAEQKKGATDNWKARYETRSSGENITEFPSEPDKFYFDASYKPVQVNNKFISIILTISAYAGGAHGYEVLTSYNYDIVNKKEVALADLFPNDFNYLKTISDFTSKDLAYQFRTRLEVKTKSDEQNFQDSALPMLMDGTTPTLDNFSVFTFTSNSITFYFNQYQVAPYAMGGSTVLMPRK